jgi:hypothetical protein
MAEEGADIPKAEYGSSNLIQVGKGFVVDVLIGC